ncbi:hypothetical protein KO525_06425 [Psychrosphaera sp. B3R10]|uniref:hypothetical protein n=1 Tax=unclassified Psychrosphaera TaxID=2641570 RepID=UPI001C0948C7|nr:MULTISPECIES: hypothetical protein [unclassified Psychrosphaera]MBU2882331.1 hypothetical protein [Psychrosphaera sp. I2R16]MBU2989012.1 hypothetical protein [Psychrosphaera sp. B3R10]
MALNISKLLKQEAYACIQTSLGDLCVFGISYKNQTDLEKDLETPIKDCLPTEFIRNFCVYICFPKSSLKEEKYKPHKPVLTIESVKNLTEDDLERIAGVYIDNNEYLFKKLEFKKKKNEKGEIVSSGEYKDIEHPRNKKETNISYLYRLSVLQMEKRKKEMEELFKSVSGLGSFSSTLTDSIKDTLAMGDSLSKSIESIRPVQMAELRPVERESFYMDFAKIEQSKEESRLQPSRELADRLDQLIESSVQASEFMIEANKIQTSIATEIKVSGDLTDKHSRKNIRLSWVVITLTVLGMIFTAYSFISGNRFNEYQQIKLEQSAKEIVNSLTSINTKIVNQTSISQNTLDSISKQLVETNNQKKLYEQLLAQHKSLIESLQRATSEQKAHIIDLQERIIALEENRKTHE